MPQLIPEEFFHLTREQLVVIKTHQHLQRLSKVPPPSLQRSWPSWRRFVRVSTASLSPVHRRHQRCVGPRIGGAGGVPHLPQQHRHSHQGRSLHHSRDGIRFLDLDLYRNGNWIGHRIGSGSSLLTAILCCLMTPPSLSTPSGTIFFGHILCWLKKNST